MSYTLAEYAKTKVVYKYIILGPDRGKTEIELALRDDWQPNRECTMGNGYVLCIFAKIVEVDLLVGDG